MSCYFTGQAVADIEKWEEASNGGWVSCKPNETKNLILITSDELRYDCVGVNGNRGISTPHLDGLAKAGVVMDNHFTNFPKCVPARISMMTGRYAHTDGYRTIYQHMRPEQCNLLTRLLENNYTTALFGKNHCWDDSEFKAGFDAWSDSPEYGGMLEGITSGWRARTVNPGIGDGWDYIGDNSRHAADAVFVDQCIRFLEERDRQRPFFLQLNMESPHPWYGVEEPWFSMYDRNQLEPFPDQLPEGVGVSWQAQRKIRTGEGDVAAAAREIQAVYFGMISEMDARVGRLLDYLRAHDLMENSVIVFLSDHGDYAGQYGLAEKWDTVFPEALVKVPLFIVAPDLPAGQRRSFMSDHTDLAPTLLELLGLQTLPGMHGRSLVPSIMENKEHRLHVFSEGGHEAQMRSRFNFKPHTPRGGGKQRKSLKQEVYRLYPDSMARARMVRSRTHKLVVRETGENELYDLAADPWELRNIYYQSGLEDVKCALLLALGQWCLETDPDAPYQEFVGA